MRGWTQQIECRRVQLRTGLDKSQNEQCTSNTAESRFINFSPFRVIIHHRSEIHTRVTRQRTSRSPPHTHTAPRTARSPLTGARARAPDLDRRRPTHVAVHGSHAPRSPHRVRPRARGSHTPRRCRRDALSTSSAGYHPSHVAAGHGRPVTHVQQVLRCCVSGLMRRCSRGRT